MRWRPTTTRTSPEAVTSTLLRERLRATGSEAGSIDHGQRPSGLSRPGYRPMPQGGYDGTAVDTLAWQYVPGGWPWSPWTTRRGSRAPTRASGPSASKLSPRGTGQYGRAARRAVLDGRTFQRTCTRTARKSSTGKPAARADRAGRRGRRGSTADKYHIGSALTVTVSEGFPVCGPSNAGRARRRSPAAPACVYEVDGKVSGVGVGADGHDGEWKG